MRIRRFGLALSTKTKTTKWSESMSKKEKKPMTISEILPQLSSLKDNSESFATEPGADEIWSKDIRALEETTGILCTMQDEGINSAEELKDLIFDYKLAVKHNQEYVRKFGTPERVYPKDDVWHCPECNHRVQINHSFCHWCGKRLAWR